MHYNSFKYSARVWLCSVLAAPAIFLIAPFLLDSAGSGSISARLPIYMLLTFYEFLFSLVTWLIFWIIVELTNWLIDRNSLRKLLLSFIGIMLTVATFRVFPFFESFSFSDSLCDLMLINCACIGLACWLFSLEQKTTHPSRINPYLYETEK